MNRGWVHGQGADAGVVLALKIQPRASRSEVVGVQGNELKVRVAAPPVDDAANEELIRFLAKALGCSRSAVRLLRGRSSPHKVVAVQELGVADVVARLAVREATG